MNTLPPQNVTELHPQDWDLLVRAERVAATAHAGQLDKLGKPYLSHCERVAARVPGQDEKIVAYLHDVLEKGQGWSASKLRNEGFPEPVVRAVEVLTRQPGEADDAYLAQIVRHPIASIVKVADLEDNIEQAQRAGTDAARYRSELRAIGRMTGLQPQQTEQVSPPHNPVRRAIRSLLAELGLKSLGRR